MKGAEKPNDEEERAKRATASGLFWSIT